MNGSVKMIDSLVEQLNNAKLDGSTGTSIQPFPFSDTSVRGRDAPRFFDI